MMNDDDRPLHDSIKPAGCQICLNPVWLVGNEGEPGPWALAKPETAAHRSKLDSEKFSDEARPNRWLDLIVHSLKVLHYTLMHRVLEYAVYLKRLPQNWTLKAFVLNMSFLCPAKHLIQSRLRFPILYCRQSVPIKPENWADRDFSRLSEPFDRINEKVHLYYTTSIPR